MLLAFVFESVGAGEWLVLLAVLLVVIGPKNLPSTLRKLGGYYAKFRRAADNFKRQLMDMDREFERSFNEAVNSPEDAAPQGESVPSSVASAEGQQEGVASDGDRPDQQT